MWLLLPCATSPNKRHNNTAAPLGVSAEASQQPQWAEVFMNGREVEECVSCVCACQERSAGLLCFSSPPRLSSSLPTPRRRAMNHNHARARFELKRPPQPPAQQMHLMTGGAPVRLQHATLTCHRSLAGGPSACVSRARGSDQSSDWPPGKKVKVRYLVFFFYVFIF